MQMILPLLKLKTVLGYNKLVYNFQRIPLLGHLIPDKLYKGTKIQGLMFALGLIQQVLRQIFGKAAYFFWIYFLAVILKTPAEKLLGLPVAEVFLIFLLAISLGYGAIIKNLGQISPDQEDALWVKIYGMDPRVYYKTLFLYDHILGGIFYVLGLGISLHLLGKDPLGALYFSLLVLGVRLGVRYFVTLYAVKKVDLDLNDLSGNLIFKGLLVPLVLVVGLVLGYWQTGYNLSRLAFSLGGGILGLGLLAFFYRKVFHTALLHVLSQRVLRAKMAKNEGEVNLAQVAMSLEDKDLVLDLDERIQNLRGIAFINEVFYHRLSKQFYKMVRIRVIILSLASLAILGGLFFFKDKLGVDPSKVGAINRDIRNYLPGILIYFSALMYVSNQLAQLSFYHLDRTLMGDPLYRSPKMVLYSLRVRFKKALKMNLPLLGISMALVLGVKVLLPWIQWKLVFFIYFWQVLLMFFFSLYYLYLYYIIQPYDVEMKVKSPLYQVINFFVFIFSYQSMQIFGNLDNPQPAYMGLAGLLLVFLIAGYFAVQVLAPKNFKLRH